MIGYWESFIDGFGAVVGDDGFLYTAEEYADLLEEQAVARAEWPDTDGWV
ncbi:hypothetical protein [Nocardia sp. R6R-6]